jgi:Rieske Fe-S protein
MTAKHPVAVIAGVTLLLLAGCTTTTGGSGTRATATVSGSLSSTSSTATAVPTNVTTSEPPSSTPSTARTTIGMIPYDGDRFTVLMPGKPVKSSQRATSAAGPVKITILLVQKDSSAFNVAYTDFPTGAQVDVTDAARGSAGGMKGQLTDVKHVTYRGRPAVDFRIINGLGGTVTGFARDVVVVNRVYQLFVIVLGSDVKTPPVEYPLMRDSLTF